MGQMQHESLLDSLVELAQRNPDQPSLIFISDDGTEETVTAARMYANTVAYAQALDRAGVSAGDFVALVLDHSLGLFYAIWGAIYLGAAPSIELLRNS